LHLARYTLVGILFCFGLLADLLLTAVMSLSR
jgi:hypothetical protein